MPDPLSRAAYCLKQSEQCLRLAALTEADRRDEYYNMAKEYLELAAAERRMADLAEADLKAAPDATTTSRSDPLPDPQSIDELIALLNKQIQTAEE